MRRALLALAILAVTACGDSDDSAFVGGECRDDEDCFEDCERGNDFPGGICTVRCRDDVDCPGFAFCIDREGGICLEECDLDRECRPGYECKNEDREGAPGDASVCIGD